MTAHLCDAAPRPPPGRPDVLCPERRRPFRASFRGCVVGCVTCALILAATLATGRGQDSSRALEPARPAAGWIRASRAPLVFGLAGVPFAQPAVADEWRRTDGSGRRESVTWGTFGKDELFVRLTLGRPGAAEAPQPFFADMAVQAALVGAAVVRIGAPTLRPSVLGDLMVATAQLAEGRVQRACQIFRNEDLEVGISGILCEKGAAVPDGAALDRLLGRLVLTDAGADEVTRAFFAKLHTSAAGRPQGFAATVSPGGFALRTAALPGAPPPPASRRRHPRLPSLRPRVRARPAPSLLAAFGLPLLRGSHRSGAF